MLWGAGNNLETKFFLSLNEHLENMFGGIQMKISGISFFPHHTVTEIECHIDLWYETQKIFFHLQFMTGSERHHGAIAHILKGKQGYLSVIMFSDWSSSIKTLKLA